MSTSRVLAGILGPMMLVEEPISTPYLKGEGVGAPQVSQEQSPKLLSRCAPLQGVRPRTQF